MRSLLKNFQQTFQFLLIKGFYPLFSYLKRNRPLAGILNSLKSYHAMRSEQSMTLASSLKEEVVLVLKAMLKKEAEETKRVFNNAKKNDNEMKTILEKIETV